MQLLCNSAALLACTFAAAGWTDPGKIKFIDLKAKGNQKLAYDFHESTPGNNMDQVPRGVQILADAKFKIEETLIQLGSRLKPNRPDKVVGIPVNTAFRKLHLLQATEFGESPEGDERHISTGTTIAHYVVHYEDGSQEKIPVIYGEDVRDWWFNESSRGVERGKVAWQGTNEFSKRFGARIRLYTSSWENPKPSLKVVSIDFESSMESVAAPFCVALTAELQ